MVERSHTLESALESNVGNREISVLKHRECAFGSVLVEHFLEIGVHITVKGPRKVLIIVALFTRDRS